MINEVKCIVPECKNVFRTTEPVSKRATFTCREHTGKPEAKLAFQQHAFDDHTLGSAIGEKPSLDQHDRNDR